LDENGRSLKSSRKDPIYQNLRNKESSPGQNSAKTELEDIDDIAKTDMAIRISHYVDNEVENELNEVVIPLKDSSDTDTLENQEVEELICTLDKSVEEQVLCTPEKLVKENTKEQICIPDNNVEENAKEFNSTPEKNIEELKITTDVDVEEQQSTHEENS
jgi:hypothetical protein